LASAAMMDRMSIHIPSRRNEQAEANGENLGFAG